jgi:hypothetical protein
MAPKGQSGPVSPLEDGLEAKFAVINIKTKQYKVTKVSHH